MGHYSSKPTVVPTYIRYDYRIQCFFSKRSFSSKSIRRECSLEDVNLLFIYRTYEMKGFIFELSVEYYLVFLFFKFSYCSLCCGAAQTNELRSLATYVAISTGFHRLVGMFPSSSVSLFPSGTSIFYYYFIIIIILKLLLQFQYIYRIYYILCKSL